MKLNANCNYYFLSEYIMLENTQFITSGLYKESKGDFEVRKAGHVFNYINGTRIAQLILYRWDCFDLTIWYHEKTDDFINTYCISNYTYHLAINKDVKSSEISSLSAAPYDIKCSRHAVTDYVSLGLQLNFGKMDYPDSHDVWVAGLYIFVTRIHISYCGKLLLHKMANNYDIMVAGGDTVLFNKGISQYTSFNVIDIPQSFNYNDLRGVQNYGLCEGFPLSSMPIKPLLITLIGSINRRRNTKRALHTKNIEH